jgi:hypothetical protein
MCTGRNDVRKGKLLLGAALICTSALGIQAPGSAQQKTGTLAENASGSEMSDRATNRALLDALVKKRAEVAQSAREGDGKRYALEFLDRQIAKVRRDIGD